MSIFSRASAAYSRVRIALDHLAQRLASACCGRGLVAADVDDLLEVADGLQIVGVGRRGVARIERDELVGVGDRLGVVVGLVVGVGGHQDRAARPLRIGVLALHLAEVVDRLAPLVPVQPRRRRRRRAGPPAAPRRRGSASSSWKVAQPVTASGGGQDDDQDRAAGGKVEARPVTSRKTPPRPMRASGRGFYTTPKAASETGGLGVRPPRPARGAVVMSARPPAGPAGRGPGRC